MKEVNYIALLSISEFPQNKKDKNRLVKWLKKVAEEVETSDPKIFVKSPKFRLMK